MTQLLWFALVLAVICTLWTVGAMIYASVDGKVTNLDYMLMLVGAITLVVDVVGGVAGIVLVTAVLDDSGVTTLAGWMTAVPLGFLAMSVVPALIRW